MEFYITQQTHKEIQDKIEYFQNLINDIENNRTTYNIYHIESYLHKINFYQQIIDQSTIIPVELNWNFRLKTDDENISETFALPSHVSQYMQKNYPNGIIIKPDLK